MGWIHSDIAFKTWQHNSPICANCPHSQSNSSTLCSQLRTYPARIGQFIDKTKQSFKPYGDTFSWYSPSIRRRYPACNTSSPHSICSSNTLCQNLSPMNICCKNCTPLRGSRNLYLLWYNHVLCRVLCKTPHGF